jgi:hypothetical protein
VNEDEEMRQLIRTIDGDLRPYMLAVIGALSIRDDHVASSMLKEAWKNGLAKVNYRRFYEIVNSRLFKDERELTSHGISRSFRFWTEAEKKKYLTESFGVLDFLREGVNGNICFAYGTALAVARSSDLIPHDDDIDFMIALPKDDFGKYDKAAKYIIDKIKNNKGVIVRQAEAHLIHVRAGGSKFDIFVALQEGDYLACFPGPRRVIEMADVFPPSKATLFGIAIPMPAKRETYLEKVYGRDWLRPNPFFSHNWNKEPHADLF